MTDWTVHNADVEDAPDVLDEPVDAVLCDPPYGLGDPSYGDNLADVLRSWLDGDSPDLGSGFMGAESDQVQPPAAWQAIREIAKPGAWMASFGGTRTFDLQGVAQRLGGWVPRDQLRCLMWAYGSGFPKSHDISKAIDDMEGADREVVGEHKWAHVRGDGSKNDTDKYGDGTTRGPKTTTAPATDEAEQWDGWGTALAPAHEPIGLWRKPTDRTFAECATEEGCGAIHIDGCRVAIGDDETKGEGGPVKRQARENGVTYGELAENASKQHNIGRWPSNFALCHHPACGEECVPQCHTERLDEQSGDCSSHGRSWSDGSGDRVSVNDGWNHDDSPSYTDTGGASRYFPRFRYCAKAARYEREAGLFDPLDGRTNQHVAVKPVELCEWLATLLLPPERDTPRRILISYSGSGSEMIGAMLAGWDEVIGIERDAEHCEVARKRLAWWEEHGHDAIDAHRDEVDRRQHERETGQKSLI